MSDKKIEDERVVSSKPEPENQKSPDSKESFYRIVFETSRDAIMILDEGKFTDCNPATLEIFGCKTKEEFCKLGPADLSPPKQPDGKNSMDEAKKHIDKALKDGEDFFQWTHCKTNKEPFSAEVILARFSYKGKPVLQAKVHDISNRKFFEINLQKKVEEAEKMNKLMIGRELKMIELKKEIDRLKNSPQSRETSEPKENDFQEAINFEEKVILRLHVYYEKIIEESHLKTDDKKKINDYLHVLLEESKGHEAALKELSNYARG